ncbi:unnamed protein product, partial [Staurois parvus]
HSAHRLHKKKNVAYSPNKDQRPSGKSLDLSGYTRMMPAADFFYKQREKMPPSPAAFHGLLRQCHRGEPENAANLSAS